MEESGKVMKWNSSDGYFEYKVALKNLQESLGIDVVDYIIRPELAPYLTRILQYLNKKLILLGDSSEISEKLQEVFDTFDYGANLIVNLEAYRLAKEIGVTDEDDDKDPHSEGSGDTGESDVLDDDIEDEEEVVGEGTVPYEQDRFIFCWSNVMSSLVIRLKIQYASLLYEPTQQGCPCCCGKGESWKDWEGYASGVYPEDEEYTNYAFAETTSHWNTTASRRECGCGYRA
jgi:hypothetical protein